MAGAYAVANIQLLFRVICITTCAVYIDRNTDPIAEFFEELWWIDVIFLVMFMISAICYLILLQGLSKFKRWIVGSWLVYAIVEMVITISKELEYYIGSL